MLYYRYNRIGRVAFEGGEMNRTHLNDLLDNALLNNVIWITRRILTYTFGT